MKLKLKIHIEVKNLLNKLKELGMIVGLIKILRDWEFLETLMEMLP